MKTIIRKSRVPNNSEVIDQFFKAITTYYILHLKKNHPGLKIILSIYPVCLVLELVPMLNVKNFVVGVNAILII